MSVETRSVRDERFSVLAFDQGKHIVQRAKDGAVVALGTREDRVLVEGARLVDAGGGRLLLEGEGVLRVLETSSLRELRRIELGGRLNAACLATGGVLFAQQVADDSSEYLWSPDQGQPVSFGQTRRLLSCGPALAADGRNLAWLVCRQERELTRAERTDDGVSAAEYSLGKPEFDLARLELDSGRLTLTALPAPVCSLAVGGDRTWLLLDRGETSVLIGVWDGGLC